MEPGILPGGLKARDVTAWGEAQRAKPQVKVRKETFLALKRAGFRVGMSGCFVSVFQAWGILCHRVTWGYTRYARSAQAVISLAFSPL